MVLIVKLIFWIFIGFCIGYLAGRIENWMKHNR